MKKHFVLFMLLSLSSVFSQVYPETIFNFWDMDQWNAFSGGSKTNGEDDWHDMDFVSINSNLLLDCSDCKWKLKLTNSQGVSLSTDIIDISGTTIYPYWDTPNSTNITLNFLHLEGHFWPVKYDIYVYTANEVPINSLNILNRNINLYDSYLYDTYNYYNSEISSFSANMN